MDFVGEIVEHEVTAPEPPQPMNASALTGFPDLKFFTGKRKSKFSAQRELRSHPAQNEPHPCPTLALRTALNDSSPTDDPINDELQSIHIENEQRIAKMSSEEITQAQREISEMFDPKLLKGLLNRHKKSPSSLDPDAGCCDLDSKHVHAEGHNGWIGGIKTASGYTDFSQWDAKEVEKALMLTNDAEDALLVSGIALQKLEPAIGSKKTSKPSSTKHVAFEHPTNSGNDTEHLSEDDQVAPDDYQIISHDEDHVGVHFPHPRAENAELDINDPDFYDKLHEKYYPDLPKETDKLSWMTAPVPTQVDTTYESISDMRFDFQGNLVPLYSEGGSEKATEIPTYKGLHHHSDNPHLAGYTLPELVHLSRSVVAGQRCLSIQILGRILHKLGKHSYNFLPVSESKAGFDESMSSLRNAFEQMMWDLIEQLRIIDSIGDAANEQRTKNLSVRSYAIEALWLWKQGGGRLQDELEEDAITKAVNGQ